MPGKLVMKFRKGQLLSSEVDGMKGPNCLAETRKFLDGLGIDPDDFKDVHKPELGEQPEAQVQGQG